MSLLLIEDDSDVRTVLKRIASPFFDEIHEAADAYQAMVFIEKRLPDVVISDWDLCGELSGVDVANYLAQKVSSTKLVLITGKSMIQLKAKTAHLSIDYYIAKPFSLAEFRQVLKSITNTHT